MPQQLVATRVAQRGVETGEAVDVHQDKGQVPAAQDRGVDLGLQVALERGRGGQPREAVGVDVGGPPYDVLRLLQY
ncbi:MAG: hypothetical protein U0237_19440 [Thermoleophilia bacterium]